MFLIEISSFCLITSNLRCQIPNEYPNLFDTRMHSSRMRTARSSIRRGGGAPSVMAFCCGLLLCPSVMAFWFGSQTRRPPDQKATTEGHTPQTRHPPPKSRPPGIRHPPGADTPKSRHTPGSRHPPGADTPPRSRPQQEQTPPPPGADTPPEFLTHDYDNINLPQTSFAGGKYVGVLLYCTGRDPGFYARGHGGHQRTARD